MTTTPRTIADIRAAVDTRDPQVADDYLTLLDEIDRLTGQRDQARGLAASLMEADAKRDDESGITSEKDDRRRRIYIDGDDTAWIDHSQTSDGTQWITKAGAVDDIGLVAEAISERTGSLREIGRCW